MMFSSRFRERACHEELGALVCPFAGAGTAKHMLHVAQRISKEVNQLCPCIVSRNIIRPGRA